MSEADSRRLMPKLFAKICRIIEFQDGSCLYVTAAVQAGLTPQRGQSDPSSFRLIGVCRELRCTHSTYMFNKACLGSLMRFGVIGFRPLHLVPFSSFSPSHTSVLLFFSCPPVFMSFISSFLSFARTWVPALACTRTTTCTLNSGFRWPRSL